MPTALDLAEVLGIHPSDAAGHVFQCLAACLSRFSNGRAERQRGGVRLTSARQQRLRDGLAPRQSPNAIWPAKLDMFPLRRYFELTGMGRRLDMNLKRSIRGRLLLAASPVVVLAAMPSFALGAHVTRAETSYK